DGGMSWNRPWTPGISSNLYDVEMVTLDTVFTSGVSGEIFRSTDEGESFQEMNTPTNEVLYGLEFVNSNLGFSCGFNGVILKTEDGGDNWEIKETGTISRLFDVEFINENIGVSC
ncbi:MAG: YCF48-related protein, partial [Bacteroidota bacterium]